MLVTISVYSKGVVDNTGNKEQIFSEGELGNAQSLGSVPSKVLQ